eukprot:scaffold1726_cov260-Pinguiococcus_pyrenoidosus.AAC.17
MQHVHVIGKSINNPIGNARDRSRRRRQPDTGLLEERPNVGLDDFAKSAAARPVEDRVPQVPRSEHLRGEEITELYAHFLLPTQEEPLQHEGSKLHGIDWLEDPLQRDPVGQVAHEDAAQREGPWIPIDEPAEHLDQPQEEAHPQAAVGKEAELFPTALLEEGHEQASIFQHERRDALPQIEHVADARLHALDEICDEALLDY